MVISNTEMAMTITVRGVAAVMGLNTSGPPMAAPGPETPHIITAIQVERTDRQMPVTTANPEITYIIWLIATRI
jgi:hypothetical protein